MRLMWTDEPHDTRKPAGDPMLTLAWSLTAAAWFLLGIVVGLWLK